MQRCRYKVCCWRGVVDTGSDLTIMGKEATVAKLRKRDFHKKA